MRSNAKDTLCRGWNPSFGGRRVVIGRLKGVSFSDRMVAAGRGPAATRFCLGLGPGTGARPGRSAAPAECSLTSLFHRRLPSQQRWKPLPLT